MKIAKVNIAKFRGFRNQDFELGSMLTAIAGQNGTQKSTLLGIITQTFTLKKDNPMRLERPLCGGSYISGFRDKFRLSPVFDTPGNHEWTLSFDNGTADFTVESIRRSESEIRFWKKGARKSGDGYIDMPTIFLSLKRLVPLAEESKIKLTDGLLTNDEVEEFKRLHNKILISQTPIKATSVITTPNKLSLGVTTEFYDWNQNSMGQDNLAKIILALFSFKRLQRNYPSRYNGGILAIDELDATMYPASQVELLKVLRKYASDLKLQILFTTHSPSLLSAVNDLMIEVSGKMETKEQVKLVYLQKLDDEIKIFQSIDFKRIILNLAVTPEENSLRAKKIIVYTEDHENIVFAKALLKRKTTNLKFVDVTISCSKLIDLVSMKIPAFMAPNSIVIIDGDVRNNKSEMKKLTNAKNILILPGKLSPERLLANYLFGLSDGDKLWSTMVSGYSKQFCFREYALEQINAPGEQGRQNAKKWFNSQLPFWGRGAVKVLNPLFDSLKVEKDAFLSEFEKIVSYFNIV